MATERDTKRCPDCAEDVLAQARVCRYCGYRFERPEGAQRGLLGSLFATRPRSQELTAVEILATWNAGLAGDEGVALLALGRIGDHDGYLAITDRRLFFFEHDGAKSYRVAVERPLASVLTVDRSRGQLTVSGDSWKLSIRDLSRSQAEQAEQLLAARPS